MGDVGKTLADAATGAFQLVTNPVGKIGQMTGDFVGGDVGKGIRDVSSAASLFTPGGLGGSVLGGMLGTGDMASKAGNIIGGIGDTLQKGVGSAGQLGNMLSGGDTLGKIGEIGQGVVGALNSPLGSKAADYALKQGELDTANNNAKANVDQSYNYQLELLKAQQEEAQKQRLSNLLAPSKSTSSTSSTAFSPTAYSYI